MELSLNNIYPIIKAVSNQAFTGDEIQAIVLKDGETPIAKNLAADLMTFYGNEVANTYQLLNQNHLRPIGINEGDLHKIAAKNYINYY